MKLFLPSALILLASTHKWTADAMTACPLPFDVDLGNGEIVQMTQWGDESVHFQRYNDYTVLKNQDNKWTYAMMNQDGELEPSLFEVQKDGLPPAGIPKRLRGRVAGETYENIEAEIEAAKKVQSGRGLRGKQQRRKLKGTVPNLVVPIRFADHKNRELPSRSDLDVLFNSRYKHSTLAPTGSVKGYYDEISYGQLELDSLVVDWVDISMTEYEVADGCSAAGKGDCRSYGVERKITTAILEALQYLDDEGIVDFADFDADGDGVIDAFTVMHSGFGASRGGTDQDGAETPDRIWSHKGDLYNFCASTGSKGCDWEMQHFVSSDNVRVEKYNVNPALWGLSGSEIGRIGVIVHELGHFLGLPDLYDYDYDGKGIGRFDIMSDAWGVDNSQLYPPHPSAWSRIEFGWAEPVEAIPGRRLTVAASELLAPSRPQIYKVGDGKYGYPSGEYLLIENRQPIGFDKLFGSAEFRDGSSQSGGILVTHVDERKENNSGQGHPGQEQWPSNGNHYKVAILQADGEYDLENGNNYGTTADLFKSPGATFIGPQGSNTGYFPNTDSYQYGNVKKTGVVISRISSSANYMSFDFEYVVPTSPPSRVSWEKTSWSSYVNDYDKRVVANHVDEYGQLSAICGISSRHSNHHEDRQFRFKYCNLDVPVQSEFVDWTSWSQWDRYASQSCPPDSFISSMVSDHSNHREDRQFVNQCRRYAGLVIDECYSSGYVNNFDETFDFECKDDYVLQGVTSYHSNSREDRRFKYNCCSFKQAPLDQLTGPPCENEHDSCEWWASQGECQKNPGYMLEKCKPACGVCSA